MSFFHLRTLPGYDWPPLADAAISQAWIAYLELERTQWLAPEELQRRQLEQVRALLAHCVTHVPYYRDTLPKAGIVPGAIQSYADFRRIPFLTRQTYQEKLSALVAAKLPAGTVATSVRRTGGTNGVSVLQTNLVNLWWCAFWLRELEWAKFDPTGVLASLLPTGSKAVSLPHWLPMLDPVIKSGMSHQMDVQQDPRAQMEWLRSLAPHYLCSSPANLEALALFARQDGPLPSLRAILSLGATLSDATQAVITSAFGVPVTNSYRCLETGFLASSCPQGLGLHVHAENVLLEVLDADGQPCAPGATGRVYVTDLHNFRGPFLRYELGDEATLGPASCACGRGLPLLTHIQRQPHRVNAGGG